MSSEWIVNFSEDFITLANLGPANKGSTKLLASSSKLKQWMPKHQNDLLTENSKSKLLLCLDILYRIGTKGINSATQITQTDPSNGTINLQSWTWEESLCNAAIDVISVYLQMPEGKLLSSKDKKKALNWLETLQGVLPKRLDELNGKAISDSSSSSNESIWILISAVEELIAIPSKSTKKSNKKVEKIEIVLTLLSANDEKEEWLENFILPEETSPEIVEKIREYLKDTSELPELHLKLLKNDDKYSVIGIIQE